MLGSNGEKEGILSVMVMMHSEWLVPIIYYWMIMAGGSILWVMVMMPRKGKKGSTLNMQACARLGFRVMD